MSVLKFFKKEVDKELYDCYLHVPGSYVIFGVTPISFLSELMNNASVNHFSYDVMENNILAITIEDPITIPLMIILAKEYVFLMSALIIQSLRNNFSLGSLGIATLTLGINKPKIAELSVYFYKTLDIIKNVDIIDRLIEKRMSVEDDE